MSNQLKSIGSDELTVEVNDDKAGRWLVERFTSLYRASTQAGHNATEYWAELASKSEHPLSQLAHVPGVFAALWTPEAAPKTALTLGSAGLGFVSVPKNLVHFTTPTGVRGIAASGQINASRYGLFGPGVYLTSIGRPMNIFIRARAKIPIFVNTPSGTIRIIPWLVYVRWGLSPIRIK